MARQSSHNYKTYKRNERKATTEQVFAYGMKYSDSPLPPGHCKLLINMVPKDRGRCARPRGGWKVLGSVAVESHGSEVPLLQQPYLHHSGTSFITDPITHQTRLIRYSLAVDASRTSRNPDYVNLSNVWLMVDPDTPLPVVGEEHQSIIIPDGNIQPIKQQRHHPMTHMHNMRVEQISPSGVYGIIEGNTYLLTPTGLGRMHLYYEQFAGQWEPYYKIMPVTPLSIMPLQAVNYGYNMLLDNPYHFENTPGPDFRGQGILPYDPQTNQLLMSADVGKPIRFKLIYQYKQNTDYRIKWQIQELGSSNLITIQEANKSPTYKNGQEIYIDYTPPYKRFSLIATTYESHNLNEPIRVTILSAYTLSDGVNRDKAVAKNFDLKTAQQMCSWKNQLVLWGVTGADMSIFISEVNDPTYFPFPHNMVSFSSRVLKAFPYQDDLIVITENSIELVKLEEVGFSTVTVQSNLHLTESDIIAMYGIRNLVCFKDSKYYFMIVPDAKNKEGLLQIAPISENITYLLDDFETQIKNILFASYGLGARFKCKYDDITIELFDYTSIPDSSRLRHVYKLKITIPNVDILYVDFHLVYDTIFRTWHIEIVQSTKANIHLYQSIATGHSYFLVINHVTSESNWTTRNIQIIQIDETSTSDEFSLDNHQTRYLNNIQVLDTGKRNINGNIKKRMRSIILEINNVDAKEIQLHHLAVLDDQYRSSILSYNIYHETDPNSPAYGHIYIEQDIKDPGATILPDVIQTFYTAHKIYGETILDFLSLGNSQFPEQTVLKLHLATSGKGYYPRLIFITQNSHMYELNQITWVYRDINMR